MARIRRLPDLPPTPLTNPSSSSPSSSGFPGAPPPVFNPDDTIVVNPQFRLSGTARHSTNSMASSSPTSRSNPSRRRQLRRRNPDQSPSLRPSESDGKVKRINPRNTMEVKPEGFILQEPNEQPPSTTTGPVNLHKQERSPASTVISPHLDERQLAIQLRLATRAEIEQLQQQAEEEEQKLDKQLKKMRPENLKALMTFDDGDAEGARRSKKRRVSVKSAFFRAVMEEWSRDVEQASENWTLDDVCKWRNNQYREGD